MREGLIWQTMLKLGIFTPHQILQELNPPGFLKNYVRRKIYSLIETQLRANLLEVINNRPYLLKIVNAKTKENIFRKCPLCGKEFIPVSHKHTYCKNCKKIYRANKCKEIKRKKGARENYRWSEEELKTLKEYFPDLRFNTKKAQILSKEIKRSVIAIKYKLKKMRKELKNAKNNS